MTESGPNNFETPVTACRGKLIDPSKYPTGEYKGGTIYFCNEAWLQAFHTDLVDGETSLVLLEIADKRLYQEKSQYHQQHP